MGFFTIFKHIMITQPYIIGYSITNNVKCDPVIIVYK